MWHILDAQNKTKGLPYIRVTFTHGLPEIGVNAAGVGVFDFRLGSHFWGGNMLHTHVHKACKSNTA